MNTDFSKFVLSMMEVLVDTRKPPSVRQMAGILFKRAISSLVSVFHLSRRCLERAYSTGKANGLE